jgi:hypothetical protein
VNGSARLLASWPPHGRVLRRTSLTCLEGSHYRSLKVESNHKDVAQTGVQLVQSNAFLNAHLFGFWMSG